MGRECRRVAANWEHPKLPYPNDKYFKPLYDGKYFQDAEEWWNKGFIQTNPYDDRDPIPEKYKNLSYKEFINLSTDLIRYMPIWTKEEATHYMMYENTSEGTPISPAFEIPEELAQWLFDNNASAFADMNASYDAWLKLIKSEDSSLCHVIINGHDMSGVEYMYKYQD